MPFASCVANKPETMRALNIEVAVVGIFATDAEILARALDGVVVVDATDLAVRLS
jgi:hypothetical protein